MLRINGEIKMYVLNVNGWPSQNEGLCTSDIVCLTERIKSMHIFMIKLPLPIMRGLVITKKQTCKSA